MPETTNLSPPASDPPASNSSLKEQPPYQPVRLSVKIPQYLLKELDAYVELAGTGNRPLAIEQLLCGRLEQMRVEREQLEQERRTMEEARLTVTTEGGREAYVHRSDEHLSIEQLEEQMAVLKW